MSILLNSEHMEDVPTTQDFFELPNPYEIIEIQKHPFGIWVPKDAIMTGGLIDLLSNANVLTKYFIKNPILGPFYNILREDLGITIRQFSDLIGINSSHYSYIVNNKKGTKFQSFLSLPNQSIIRKMMTQKKIQALKDKFAKILTNKDTSLYNANSKEKLNFHPNNLCETSFNNRDYIIIPTSKWETRNVWNKVIQWMKYFVEKNKRSPTHRELKEQFGGGLYHSLNRYGLTHNDLLKILGLPLNEEKIYDWSNPKIREIPKLWAYNFFWLTYIFSPKGRSPKLREMQAKFPAFIKYLGRNTFTYNDLLKSWNLQQTDIKQINREGLLFDKIGKNCLSLLYKNAIKEPRIYYTVLESNKWKYIRPDGIVHDFTKTRLKRIKKGIYLRNGEKVDKIVEFKRTFGSMKPKDWHIYSNLANNLDIFLLIGNSNSYKVNNSKITFYSLKDLISFLRKNITLQVKSKIQPLIKQLRAITQGLEGNKQTTFDISPT